MKLLTITGARPQFIKAAMVTRAIISHNNVPINNVLRQAAKGRIKKDIVEDL
jgi:UDP-N-acetylglucosamine 2-epimerase